MENLVDLADPTNIRRMVSQLEALLGEAREEINHYVYQREQTRVSEPAVSMRL